MSVEIIKESEDAITVEYTDENGTASAVIVGESRESVESRLSEIVDNNRLPEKTDDKFHE